MFRKYAAPAMSEVDMTASADCGCGCSITAGKGGGDKDSGDKPARKRDVEDMLDEYYRELRKKLEELKRKYPDYQHPDFPDEE